MGKGPLLLVASLWGATNPFIRRGTQGLRAVSSTTRLGLARAELVFLLGNWRYVVPWVINQLGSIIYVVTLQGGDLTLTVPVTNGLTFVVTAITGLVLGEEKMDARSMGGVLMIVAGSMLCCLDEG